jgi:hypothetical protein
MSTANIKPNRNFRPVTMGGKTYPVFYNGRRVLIIDSTADKELGLDHSIVLIDKVMNLPMGWADQQEDGTFIGFVIYGPNAIQISGADLSELAGDCLWQHEWTMRH